MGKQLKTNTPKKKKALNSKKTTNAKNATKAFKQKSVAVTKPTSKLNTFVLIDRSGSMGSKWDTTIKSVNEYIDSLKREKVSGQISVAFFDSSTLDNSMSFDVVLDKQPISDAVFSANGFTPRGMTPLYDATARAVDLVSFDQFDRTALVIVTDGAENFSKEYTRETITKKLDAFKNRKWEVLFLGADFNTDQQTQLLGVSLNKSLGGSTTTLVGRMGTTATHLAGYTRTGAAVAYSDAEKSAAWADPATFTAAQPMLPTKGNKSKTGKV